ncbi:signal peptidase II [Chloroflexota bacterium]
MQKANHLQGKWWDVVPFLVAASVVVADQISKAWIRAYPLEKTIFEIGFFRLVHIQNPGASFGLFPGHSLALIIFGFVGITVILFYILFLRHLFPPLDNTLSKVALGLVLGGIAGNLIDRLCFGYVTDFIGVSIWPTFNIADSGIVVGVITLSYALLFLATAREVRGG